MTAPTEPHPKPGPRKTRKTRKTSMVKALNGALDLAMERFPEMFLIGESIGELAATSG